MLGRVKPEKNNYPLKPDTQPAAHNASPNVASQPNATSRESSEVNEMKKQIKDLTAWEITNFPSSTQKGALLLTLPFSFP